MYEAGVRGKGQVGRFGAEEEALMNEECGVTLQGLEMTMGIRMRMLVICKFTHSRKTRVRTEIIVE